MLEIQNVSKTFNAGTVNQKTALNGLNLKLNEGDFVTVIGGNGAGKSTMLNAVAGVWPVDEGKILIDGVDVTRLGEHQRAAYIGRVFQDPMTGTAATRLAGTIPVCLCAAVSGFCCIFLLFFPVFCICFLLCLFLYSIRHTFTAGYIRIFHITGIGFLKIRIIIEIICRCILRRGILRHMIGKLDVLLFGKPGCHILLNRA